MTYKMRNCLVQAWTSHRPDTDADWSRSKYTQASSIKYCRHSAISTRRRSVI